MAEKALRKIIIDEKAKSFHPDFIESNQGSIRESEQSAPKNNLWRTFKSRNVVISFILILLIWGIGMSMTSFVTITDTEQYSTTTNENGTKNMPCPMPYSPASKNNGPAHVLSEKTPDQGNSIDKLTKSLTDKALTREDSVNTLPASLSDNRIEQHKDTGILTASLPEEELVQDDRTDTLTASLTKSTYDLDKEATKHFPTFFKDPIWLVEKTRHREIYSNRLQIITSRTAKNVPRSYYQFSKDSSQLPEEGDKSNKIRGILYHASESDILDFKPEMNKSILKYSKLLIKYIRKKKSYNYFIDRFGRVYRLINDDHAAFHAGNSIWADEERIYLNLNHSFIGICFEGRDFENVAAKKENKESHDKPLHMKPMSNSSINDAQLISGKELTEWLRYNYKIPQYNCVPHALASVNAKDLLIGYHLDLSQGFPFNQFGLSDKYKEPLPSITDFGFSYDNYFLRIFNGSLWPGIKTSEEILKHRARDNDLNINDYRRNLNEKFTKFHRWKKSQQKNKSD